MRNEALKMYDYMESLLKQEKLQEAFQVFQKSGLSNAWWLHATREVFGEPVRAIGPCMII